MPLIDVQRRMVEAGRIRAGDKGPKGEPRKIENWRLTSKDRVRLERAAELWGGEPKEWAGHAGEWELYTTTASLPIMVLPDQPPVSWYELWSKGGCRRRCDGQWDTVSDAPCLCGEERECKPTTRMSVLLPDLPGIGRWTLSSTGWNAAAELAGSADILRRASAQGVLIPARLRLEQRVEVKQGQTRRFAVPVIDIDVSFRDLLGAQGSGLPSAERATLPQGYTPIAGELPAGHTLAEGLETVATQEVKRRPRGQAPIPAADDIEFGDSPVAVPVESAPDTPAVPASPTGTPAPPTGAGAEKFITVQQRKRLFAIAKSVDLDEDGLREFVKTYTGQESTSAISRDAYEPLVAAIQAQAAPA